MAQGKSRTAVFYQNNPESRAKHRKDNIEANKSPKLTKKRVELNKYNRKKGTYGNGDGLDAAHNGKKITGFKSASKNRGDKNDTAGDKKARGKKKK
jgi:hypothetical protein